MSPSVKSLASRIGEHQRKFIAAGGKSKGLKYPKDWQAEAVRLGRELEMPLSELARALGIGHSALKRWCDLSDEPKSSRLVKPARTRFVPLEIMAGEGREAARPVRPAATRVTLREIIVDIAADADEQAATAIIAALAKSGRYQPC
jgi:hypothetical protein